MSTAHATNEHATGDTVHLPGWLWAGVVLVVLVALVIGLGSWLLVSVSGHSNTLVNHETRIGAIERGIERIEDNGDQTNSKLDRILNKLP